MEVDIRSIWAIGHGVFFSWLFTTGSIVKPAVILGLRRSARASGVLLGIAMNGVCSVLIGLYPVGLIIALAPTEGLLKQGLGIDHIGALGWASPIVVLILFSSALDAAVFCLGFRQRMSRGMSWPLLSANTAGLSLAILRMVSYTVAHPAQA